jgi:Methyltransferase domain
MLKTKLSQRSDERQALVDLLNCERVRSYLEIGLRHGQTFAFVGEHLAAGSSLVGVDLPGASLWGVPEAAIVDAKARLNAVKRELRGRGHKAKIILGDSTARPIIDKVARLGPYDLVFIDGDHTLAGVRADWLNYGPMARIVAFHDIDAPHAPKLPPERLRHYGVHQHWAELRERYRHTEILGRVRGMGIGVLYRGSPCTS